MIQTNLKRLLQLAGIEEVRPSDEALEKMRMSRRRFTLLLENKHVTSMTVEEHESLKAWIEGFRQIDSSQIIGDFEPVEDLAESFGLTK
jgi:hypothetical protein